MNSLFFYYYFHYAYFTCVGVCLCVDAPTPQRTFTEGKRLLTGVGSFLHPVDPVGLTQVVFLGIGPLPAEPFC